MQNIKQILNRVWTDLDLDRKREEGLIYERWAEWVGSRIGKHSRPYRLTRYGKLIVNVDSSVWVDRLTRFHKKQILRKLNRHLKQVCVDEILFRVGKVSED